MKFNYLFIFVMLLAVVIISAPDVSAQDCTGGNCTINATVTVIDEDPLQDCGLKKEVIIIMMSIVLVSVGLAFTVGGGELKFDWTVGQFVSFAFVLIAGIALFQASVSNIGVCA